MRWLELYLSENATNCWTTLINIFANTLFLSWCTENEVPYFYRKHLCKFGAIVSSGLRTKTRIQKVACVPENIAGKFLNASVQKGAFIVQSNKAFSYRSNYFFGHLHFLQWTNVFHRKMSSHCGEPAWPIISLHADRISSQNVEICSNIRALLYTAQATSIRSCAWSWSYFPLCMKKIREFCHISNY